MMTVVNNRHRLPREVADGLQVRLDRAMSNLI